MRAPVWLRRAADRSVPLQRPVVAAVTYGLLGAAFLLGLAWLALPDYPWWEPSVNSITLVAGLTGIVVERMSAEKERRTQVLRAVRAELDKNRAVLDRLRLPDATQPVFDRLVVSAVDAALVSGALDSERDVDVVAGLHGWRDAVEGLNRRLDITEMMPLLSGWAAEDRLRWHSAMHTSNGYLDRTVARLDEAVDLVASA